MGRPQRPTSETIEWPEARVAPRVYAMVQEEPDSVNVSSDTIFIYNTFEYVLIDPNYTYPYIYALNLLLIEDTDRWVRR